MIHVYRYYIIDMNSYLFNYISDIIFVNLNALETVKINVINWSIICNRLLINAFVCLTIKLEKTINV